MSKNRVNDLPTTMRPEAAAPRIRAARDALGLTQVDICRAIRVDKSAWSKYEGGKRPLPDTVAYRFAERFGVTMDFLYRGRLDGIDEPLRGEIFNRMQAAKATS